VPPPRHHTSAKAKGTRRSERPGKTSTASHTRGGLSPTSSAKPGRHGAKPVRKRIEMDRKRSRHFGWVKSFVRQGAGLRSAWSLPPSRPLSFPEGSLQQPMQQKSIQAYIPPWSLPSLVIFTGSFSQRHLPCCVIPARLDSCSAKRAAAEASLAAYVSVAMAGTKGSQSQFSKIGRAGGLANGGQL